MFCVDVFLVSAAKGIVQNSMVTCAVLQVSIPASQIYTIDASLSPADAAVDYTNKLAKVWSGEVFY